MDLINETTVHYSNSKLNLEFADITSASLLTNSGAFISLVLF